MYIKAVAQVKGVDSQLWLHTDKIKTSIFKCHTKNLNFHVKKSSYKTLLFLAIS